MKKLTPTPAADGQSHGDAAPSEQTSDTSDLFRMFVDAVEDYAILLLDPGGRVLTWSRAAERSKGWSARDIIGQHFSRFFPPEDVQKGKPEAELKAAERDGRCEDEGWRVRKDGTRFWASVLITALRDETGELRGFAKVTRDMTAHRDAERRRIEEERSESRRLRAHGERMAQLEKIKSDFL